MLSVFVRLTRFLTSLFCRAVLCISQVMGAVLGAVMIKLGSRRLGYCLANLQLCTPEYSEQQRQQTAKHSVQEVSKTLFEVLSALIAPGIYGNSIRQVNGEEHILKAQADGRGVILVGPHLGNWDVFNAYTGRFNACVSFKPLSCHWMCGWLRWSREYHGSRLVPVQQSEGIKAMCKELGRGGVIAIFPDQVPDKSAGRVMAPFFQTPAWTGTLVSRLLKNRDALVVCGFAQRLPFGRGFNIHLRPAMEGVYSDDMEASVAALNESLEACIRQCPDQYLWQYKRFKDNIDGLYSGAGLGRSSAL